MRCRIIRNRIVLTNKTPSGLVRRFGGQQVYFALERLMQRIARELALPHIEVIPCNLIAAAAIMGGPCRNRRARNSNMGYITTVLTPEEREKVGPKGGALATATVA